MDLQTHQDSLTREQCEIVKHLLDSLADVDHDECKSRSNLVRWLRSRDWNEHEAEKMLRAHISWRVERQVDSILSWYRLPEVIDKYFPGGICGSDKYGRPLFIAPVGYFDPKSFMKAVSRTEFLQSRIYQMEYILKVILPEATAKAGRDIDRLTVIMDMYGLGFRHMSPSWLSIMTESVSMFEANYPEVLGSCFVVNAPPLFSRLYSFIKPLLSKATQEKVQVLDSNFQQTLLQYCDADSLPAVYGGSLTDPDGDPRCPSRICWAGPVPDSYCSQARQPNGEHFPNEQMLSRSSSAQSLSSSSERYTVVEVNRGAIRDIPIGVLSVGVELHWYVLCDSHDIGLGWYFRPDRQSVTRSSSSKPSAAGLIRDKTSFLADSDDSLREAVPIKRITSAPIPYKGHYRITRPGSYFMRLDNSYSWMRGKRIRYALKMILPKESHEPALLAHLSSHHSTDLLCQTNFSSCDTNMVGSSSSSEESSLVIPLPLENRSQSRLVTGGSMDVNISLLFRLFAQLLLVPKYANGASSV